MVLLWVLDRLYASSFRIGVWVAAAELIVVRVAVVVVVGVAEDLAEAVPKDLSQSS